MSFATGHSSTSITYLPAEAAEDFNMSPQFILDLFNTLVAATQSTANEISTCAVDNKECKV
jgi:hypothetical protein